MVAGYNQAFALDRSYRVAHHGESMLPPALGIMEANPVAPGVVYAHNGLTITAFTVDHQPIHPAYGYRFDYQGRSVVISGDTNVVDSLASAAQGADLLLHDGLSLPLVKAMEEATGRAGMANRSKLLLDIQDYHAWNALLGDLAEKANIGTLAIYHLVPAPANSLFANIFRRDLPSDAVITEDRMRFLLPQGSKQVEVVAP